MFAVIWCLKVQESGLCQFQQGEQARHARCGIEAETIVLGLLHVPLLQRLLQ